MRWFSLILIGFIGCAEVQSLKAPLGATKVVADGVHLVLTNADLGQLSEAVAAVVGKPLEAAIAPVAIAGIDGSELQATSIKLSISQPLTQVQEESQIAFTHSIASAALPLALTRPGKPDCPLLASPMTGSVSVQLRFTREATGKLALVLGAAPIVSLDGGEVDDSTGCLQSEPSGTLAAVRKHIHGGIKSVVENSFVTAGRSVMQQVLPASLQTSGTLPLRDGGSLSFSAAYAGPGGTSDAPGALLRHNGEFARAALHVGFDSERSACAIDAAVPAEKIAPLPMQSPPQPKGSFSLRRALVVHESVLNRAIWAAQRAGVLCRREQVTVGGTLSAQWIADVAPALSRWVKERPRAVRLWPGEAASARWVDVSGNAEVTIVLPDAEMEVVAPVAGIEVVVLRIRGTFTLQLALLAGTQGITLAVKSADVQSAAITSPLENDSLQTLETGLAALVDVLLTQTLRPALQIPLVPALGSATVRGTTRVGKRVWIWLEQTPPSLG